MFLFQFKIPIGQDEEGQDILIPHEDELVLPKSDAQSDIVMNLNGKSPLKIGGSASVQIYMIGGKITEFTWMVSQAITALVWPNLILFVPSLYCNFMLHQKCVSLLVLSRFVMS